MFKKLFLLVVVLMAQHCYAQGFVNYNRHQVKRSLLKYQAKNELQATFAETDTTLGFSLHDSSLQSLHLTYNFDAAGKCYKETIVHACDSCYQKYLANILNDKKYKWTRLNETDYISKYSKKLFLKLGPKGSFTCVITRAALTRNEYDQLLKIFREDNYEAELKKLSGGRNLESPAGSSIACMAFHNADRSNR